MKAKQKRYGTALGVAIAVHVLFAFAVGIFGYRFVTRPPEILEVALVGGGGGAPEQVEEQQDNSILRSIDDIIDKRLKPETKKVVTKKAVANNNPQPGPTNQQASGASSGTGEGSGSGSGSGTGDGTGTGLRPAIPPQKIAGGEPVYPESLRARNVKGVVVVRISVNTSGTVDGVEIVSSSGHDAMDQAAINAAWGYAYTTAYNEYGEAVRFTKRIRMEFRLR